MQREIKGAHGKEKMHRIVSNAYIGFGIVGYSLIYPLHLYYRPIERAPPQTPESMRRLLIILKW